MPSSRTPKQQRVYEANQRYRSARINLIKAAKAVPCAECGESYPYWVMDLHHPTGVHKLTGKVSFSTWAMTVALPRVRAELALCVVLCSNCHRLHHWKEKCT